MRLLRSTFAWLTSVSCRRAATCWSTTRSRLLSSRSCSSRRSASSAELTASTSDIQLTHRRDDEAIDGWCEPREQPTSRLRRSPERACLRANSINHRRSLRSSAHQESTLTTVGYRHPVVARNRSPCCDSYGPSHADRVQVDLANCQRHSASLAMNCDPPRFFKPPLKSVDRRSAANRPLTSGNPRHRPESGYVNENRR